MKALQSFEKSVAVYQSTRRDILEDFNTHWVAAQGSGVLNGGKMGRKNEYLCKKIDFVCSTKFKLLDHIKVNSVNGCEFYKGS